MEPCIVDPAQQPWIKRFNLGWQIFAGRNNESRPGEASPELIYNDLGPTKLVLIIDKQDSHAIACVATLVSPRDHSPRLARIPRRKLRGTLAYRWSRRAARKWHLEINHGFIFLARSRKLLDGSNAIR